MKPAAGVTLSIRFAVCPLVTVMETGEREREKLAGGIAVPVPVRETVWGVPEALSEIVTAPVRAPAAVGVKVTLMAQLAPAASDAPQLLLWAKSPLAAMPVIVRAALPVLLRVKDCGLLVLPMV